MGGGKRSIIDDEGGVVVALVVVLLLLATKMCKCNMCCFARRFLPKSVMGKFGYSCVAMSRSRRLLARGIKTCILAVSAEGGKRRDVATGRTKLSCSSSKDISGLVEGRSHFA